MFIFLGKGFTEKLKEVQGATEEVEQIYLEKRKLSAQELVQMYAQGITNNTLDLKPLTDRTIKRKKNKGLSKPETPLYGVGDGSQRSLKNALVVTKTKKGYKVAPSTVKHHSGKLTLDYLFNIHENPKDSDRERAALKKVIELQRQKKKDKSALNRVKKLIVRKWNK